MGKEEELQKGSQQIIFSEIIDNSNTDILVTNEFRDCVRFIPLCYDSNTTLKIYVGKLYVKFLTFLEIFNIT